MRKLEIFNQAWMQKFLESYQKNLALLVQAFVNVYGEEYRYLIESRLKEIHFVFGMWKEPYQNIKNKRGESKDIFHQYELFFKRQNRLLKRYQKEGKTEEVEKIYMQALFISELKNLKAYEFIKQTMLESNLLDAFMFPCLNQDKKEYYIVLPILAINDEILIHELNHVIGEDIELLVNDLVLNYQVFDNEEAIELINERITRDVMKQFTLFGGSICFQTYPKEFLFHDSWYDKRLWMIEDFYQAFKKLITDSWIRRDINLISKKLGPKSFQTFLDFIEILSHKKEISKNEILKLNTLISFMKEHLKRIKKEDYEDYYKELERQGWRVRRLKK